MPANLRLRGSSDTELLLAAFEHLGIRKTITAAAGMFAMAVYSRDDRTLTLIRDRLGIKPLVYSHVGSQLHFASEVKSLLTVDDFQTSVDSSALARFLQYGYVPDDQSIVQRVRKVSPGSTLTFRLDRMHDVPRDEPFWSAESIVDRQPAAGFTLNENDLIDSLESQLRRTVREHLASDVPLGAFLSGGVDSALVLAMMRLESSGPVRSFTIGFDDPRFNEAQAAAAVAKHLGSEHTEYRMTLNEVASMVPHVTQLYSEPLADTSAIPTFCLSKLTRESVTVALSGDGGDELFGGYKRYWQAPALYARLQRIPQPIRRLIARALRLPNSRAYQYLDGIKHLLAGRQIHDSLAESARKLARGLSATSLRDIYTCLSTISFNAHESSSLVLGCQRSQTSAPGPWDESRGRLANMQLWDSAVYLPHDILHKVDVATMAVGLEARVPLLDHRLFEWAWRLPPALKTSGHVGKLILRRLLRRHLPESLIDSEKRGFSAPLSQWLRGPLREWSLDTLNETSVRRTGLLDHRVVQKFTNGFFFGTESHARVWPILVFLSWHDHHVTSTNRIHEHPIRDARRHTVSVGS